MSNQVVNRNNQNCKMCANHMHLAPVKSPPPACQHSILYTLNAFPITKPTSVKAPKALHLTPQRK